jgi:hypothetical protein
VHYFSPYTEQKGKDVKAPLLKSLNFIGKSISELLKKIGEIIEGLVPELLQFYKTLFVVTAR